jgi:hypothetical protein
MLLNLLTYWYGVLNTVISLYYFTSTVGAYMGDKRTVCKVLVGKPEGKGPLGGPWHRWKDTTTILMKELGWEGMDWSSLCQDRDKRGAFVETALGIY